MSKPISSIEFHITERCNYKCAYCVQGKGISEGKKYYDASDKVIDGFINFINKLDDSWMIKLSGGEPLIHPRIFEVIEEIVKAGHKVSFTTNFSFPIEYFKKITDLGKDQLNLIVISLHLSQVKSVDEFIEKVIEFNNYKFPQTELVVVSVMTEENFEVLKEIKEKLDLNKIRIKLQHLKEDGKYARYSQEVEKYLNSNVEKISNIDNIKNKNFFGTLCYTGYKYFNIYWDGRVQRCYNKQGYLNSLGNIGDKSFKQFKEPMPCLSKKCTCTRPANNNMIRYGEKDLLKAYYLMLAGKVQKIIGANNRTIGITPRIYR